MVKVLNQYFPGRLFVLFATENALILLGVWIPIALRDGAALPLSAYPDLFGKAFLMAFACQLCFYYADLYDLRSISSRLEMLMRLLQALGVAALFLGGIYIMFPQMRLGGGVAESALLAAIFLILLWRILVEWLNRAYGAGDRILMVGSGPTVHALAREVKLRPDLPISVVGSVTEDPSGTEELVHGLPCLGTLDKLLDVIQETKPTRVVIALRERRQLLPYNDLLRLRLKGLLIEEASTLYEKLTGKIPVESIRPSALIFSEGFKKSVVMRGYERLLGLIGAVLALIISGPVMLLVALAIKLESRGPALYKQERVGQNGRTFEILKFRSMRIDAEHTSGPVWAQERDPRITRVGRIIRKLRLDELPQFINIFKGEMSFIGPRPERPFFVDQLRARIPFYDLRHSVRPGLTGWAQVSAAYGSSVEDAQLKLEYDLFYVKNVSFSLDLLVLFQTVKTVIFGRGAR